MSDGRRRKDEIISGFDTESATGVRDEVSFEPVLPHGFLALVKVASTPSLLVAPTLRAAARARLSTVPFLPTYPMLNTPAGSTTRTLYEPELRPAIEYVPFRAVNAEPTTAPVVGSRASARMPKMPFPFGPVTVP